ncbi:MAG TPA: diaminopimelate decarboxylase [Gaiellaceae bacterium]|nr:diaminopimelate decarboxylase [Gaiellaceae bacterium]
MTTIARVLSLFPDTASVRDGELVVGGVGASALAERFGTPLVVYDEQTLLANARAYREAAPEALLLYSLKAFPNLAILRLLAAEGYGADVSTLGELEFARRAGILGDGTVVHGNNKSDEELRAAAEAGVRFVVLDAPDEVDRAAAAGMRRVLVRITPGIEADTHEKIRTAHEGSKFGLPPEQAVEAIERARALGLEVAGVHLHIGSQLLDPQAGLETVDWLKRFAARGWVPGVVDLGGGLGIRYLEDDRPPAIRDFVATLLARLEDGWPGAPPQVVLEPGRSIVGPAGLTLYRVGVVKRASAEITYVAVDGGMSDNPRPQLYGARYEALLANRADDEATGSYDVAGKHCESGDVLIAGAPLPEPRRGDLLAVPSTGAYTLSMGSNYNSVPRPAAVLVRDGEARLIRRRESLDDLLRLEEGER